MSRGASVLPAASVAARSTSRSGHGRSGFTWSGVTGETPPQSSIPASTSAAEVVGLGQVGGRLQVDRRVEHQPGGGDGPEELVRVAGRRAPHRGAGLGQEVLDDHLLHVPVAGVGGGDGDEGVEPLAPGLADADQDPGGERHPGAPGGLERGEATFGGLVGGAGVRTAGLGQPGREGLDHHPLRRRAPLGAGRAPSSVSAPALAWGSRPVSARTAAAAATR